MLKKIFLIITLALSFFLAKELLAAGRLLKCDDKDAIWNLGRDSNDYFHCVTKKSPGEVNLENFNFTCNYPGSGGHLCVNEAGCNAGIYAGKHPGFKCEPAKNVMNKKRQGINNYQVKIGYCEDNSQVCAKYDPPPPPPTPQPTPVTPPAPVIKQVVQTRSVKIDPSDCCRQIVPLIDHKTESYGINYVVQVGINIFNCILCILGSLIILMTVYGGFLMLTAFGDSGKIKKGKEAITAAFIGAFIVLASYLIVGLVVKALGGSLADSDKMILKI